MASSNKTTKLKLNQWSETDCPQREDFVNDNLLVEEAITAHTLNTALHLTTTEKKRVQKPFHFFNYTGNGNASRTCSLDSSGVSPTYLTVIASGKVNGQVENGLVNVYSATKIGRFSTPGLSGSSGYRVVVQQQTQEEAETAGVGYRVRLNEKNVEYAGVAF